MKTRRRVNPEVYPRRLIMKSDVHVLDGYISRVLALFYGDYWLFYCIFG